jgi:hypothetical protein
MRVASKQDGGPGDPLTERLVLLQIAGRRYGERRERLYRTLRHIEPVVLDAAIDGLESVGVVVNKGKAVHQSSALRRIDSLGVICV